MADEVTLSIHRGTRESGTMVEYTVPRQPGMVVLDAIHSVQALHAPDLACRWNCKAGKCGSCSGEVNGKPRLMCMDRVDKYPAGEPITVRPMKTFPVIKDLVCDVSWNYEVNKKIPAFKPQEGHRLDVLPGGGEPGPGIPQVHRVLPLPGRLPRPPRPREEGPSSAAPASSSASPAWRCTRSTTRTGSSSSARSSGIGLCNITKCCTEVCPEHIKITDNAIIPLKERVVDRHYDPVLWLLRKVTGKP